MKCTPSARVDNFSIRKANWGLLILRVRVGPLVVNYRKRRVDPSNCLAFTRYSFTSSRLCTNQSSFHSSRPPALPTLLQ